MLNSVFRERRLILSPVASMLAMARSIMKKPEAENL